LASVVLALTMPAAAQSPPGEPTAPPPAGTTPPPVDPNAAPAPAGTTPAPPAATAMPAPTGVMPAPVVPGVAPGVVPGVPGVPAPEVVLRTPGGAAYRQEILDRPPPSDESFEDFMARENLERILMVAAIVVIGGVALIVTRIQRRRAGG
jgi:hypothetical protein